MSLESDNRKAMVDLYIEKADYDCFFKATKQDVEQKFEPTRALLCRIKELISSRMTDALQIIDPNETTTGADDELFKA